MICSLLVREPWNLSIKEIAELTDDQLQEIYFRPPDVDRTKEIHAYWPSPDKGMKDVNSIRSFSRGGFRQMFFEVHRIHKVPEDRIHELWEQYLDFNPRLRPGSVGA